MKRPSHNIRASVWVALLTVMIGCSDSSSRFGRDAADRVRDTVMALEAAVNLAVDGLGCQSGLDLIGDQAPLFVSAGNVVRTRAMLTQQCERMVAGRTGAVFAVDTLTAHALSPDAGYVVREGVYTISFRDSSVVSMYMVMTTLWQHEEDGWRMVHLHESWRPAP